ncbi:hypothetical protein T265_07591 [Opisthorchis viverrini]|uniref:Endonuclease/exonuclease/phosphatase domain-containing protein n=1 Tax=Opisthorchis viverrini TaxID=6198 RepID=A0A074ZNF1_OPIVI|nr:hypothetical protein T265_07591 [Opisthorchis viverrini]KER24865.1 hypothetical protein T265_07591 [Opisthorchis viverrini]
MVRKTSKLLMLWMNILYPAYRHRIRYVADLSEDPISFSGPTTSIYETIYEVRRLWNIQTRLLQMCADHRLFLCSTNFRNSGHRLTSCPPSNQRRIQIDHIAVSYRWRGLITACCSFWNTSVDSDHALIRYCFSLRFSGVRKSRTPRLTIEKLFSLFYPNPPCLDTFPAGSGTRTDRFVHQESHPAAVPVGLTSVKTLNTLKSVFGVCCMFHLRTSDDSEAAAAGYTGMSIVLAIERKRLQLIG